MTLASRHADLRAGEVELLDAEIFDVPDRLNLDDARDQTGGPGDRRSPDRRPFDQCDPEDDQ